jgi:hypothetical protein
VGYSYPRKHVVNKVDPSKTMKRSTDHRQKKIKPATVNLIRRTHGLAAEIAAVADVTPGYVSKVLNMRKPPSSKIINAIPMAMMNLARRFDRQAFEIEYPV